MTEKILKIDFQNFYISLNVSKSISWTFLGSLHNETIVKYAFHEILWKKYFTVYPRLSQNSQENTCASNFIKKETVAQVFFCEFCEISDNTFFTEYLLTTASLSAIKYYPA